MATSTITKAADYEKIVFTVGFDSGGIITAAQGFAANGVVQLILYLKEGLTNDWYNDIPLTIPEKYRPIDQIYATRRITAMADSNVGLFAMLNGNLLQVSVGGKTVGATRISFVYPQAPI